MSNFWRPTTQHLTQWISLENFSQREFTAALQHLKLGKALGPVSICPELPWSPGYVTSFLSASANSKFLRRALLVTILKLMKSVGVPKSYRPISLLCVKILKRLIYACVTPIIDPLLHKEQAGFQSKKSTMDQVILLTQNIEDSFGDKKNPKLWSIFVDLTEVCDTVWHCGITCKLLRLLPDKHMVRILMFVWN